MGAPAIVPPLDPAAVALVGRLALQIERVVRLTYPDRGPSDIHPGQWAVLRIVSRRGRATVGQIARDLGVTHAPASRAVGALGRKGLIFVTTSADDRRKRFVRLSEAGSDLLWEDPHHRLGAAIGLCSPADLATLDRVLAAVAERLGGVR